MISDTRSVAQDQNCRALTRRAAQWSVLACTMSITSVFAADSPPQPAATDTEPVLSEVVVTGSRIVQPNLSSTSPIQVITSKEIQLEGTSNIIDLLNNLPQNFQNAITDLSPTQNPLGAAGGLSTADLRGLGPQRTLVLIDGRRLGVGDPSTLNSNPAPDLNQIPPQLVERIDVVTGGASAVYGSDAIAGVVNFVMKHNFQGIQIDGQAGIDEHNNHNPLLQGLETQAGFPAPSGSTWDGQNRNLSIIMGLNSADDQGNVEGYFTYRDADPVSQGSRDFSACKLNVNPSATNPNLINTPICDGSPNSNLVGPVFNPNVTCAFGLDCLTVVGNKLLPWPQAGSSPPGIFNANPYQTLSTQDTRYMGGFFAHYDVNDYVKPYLDVSFMNDRSTSNIAPSAAFLGSNPNDPTGNGGLLVNCSPTNPLLSAQENAILCNPINNPTAYPTANGDTAVDTYIARRNIEGGPRTAEFEHNNYRAVGGLKGTAGEAWTYDAFASYYYTSLFQSQGGFLSWNKIQDALLVVKNPATGAPQCQSGSGCIPWNIWTQGAVTPAQAASLVALGTSAGSISERIVSANATGELGKYGITSPWATDGIAVNIGAEHRADQLAYSPDQEELANDLAGFSGAGTAINGGYHVLEEFIELRAPLAEHQTGAEQLTAGAAFRHSDYSTAAGAVNTFKFDLQYAPVPDLFLRASFDRAIRAPNIIELLIPDAVTNTSVVAADPCAGQNPLASFANCAHTGVTAAQYGHIAQCPAGQCATLLGGNSDLQPEKANTISYGVTFSPSYVSGFTASIDYYKILLKQEITTVPQNIALNNCLATGSAATCGLIVRTSTGALFGTTIAGGGYIVAKNLNIAAAEAAGIDAQLAYRWDVGSFGKMSATFAGSYLQHQTSQPIPAVGAYDCAGLYGPTCQTVNPRWRHIARLSWQTPLDVLLSAQWRFIGSVKLDSNTGNPQLLSSAPGYGAGVYDSFDAVLPNTSYLDVTAVWDLSKHLSVRAGVNNVLDKDPPLVSSLLAGTGSPNAYPTYDLLGRVMFAAFTAKF
jgi:outer membrane receptor protein involved in Fe transport